MSDASKVDVISGSNDVSQDVPTFPFTGLSIVARHSEPAHDRAPFAPCSVGLGTTLGGPVAMDAPTGGSPHSCLSYNIIPFICGVMGVSALSLHSVVGAGTAHSAGVSGSVSAVPPSPPGFTNLSLVASSLPAPPPVLSAPALPSFSGLFPHALPPSSFAYPLPSFCPIAAPVAPYVVPAASLPSFAPPSFPLACPSLPSLYASCC